MKKNKRIIILGAVFILFYAVVLILFRKFDISKEEIQKLIEPFGVYGVLALLVIQIIFSLTPMPDGAMPLIAMVLYGPPGVMIVMIGMFIASIIHYEIGKILGKEFILKHFPKTEKFLNKMGSRHVIFRLVALRLFTFVSFDITSYIAGISKIKLKTFLIATSIGLLPTNIVLILIGYGLFAKSSVDIVATWGLLILIFTVLFIFYKKSKIK